MAMSPPRSSSSSPPKQQHSGDGNKLVNRLGLGTLSLRPRWRVMVLGHQSVGKSAFVVRYLTRRFIGDYDPQLERCFPLNATIHGDHVLLELLDSGGHHLEDGSQSELEAKIRWADAFVLMYSVTDKCSFDECCRLRFLIGYNKRRRRHLFGSSFCNSPCADVLSSCSSVALVANKIDQVEDRMVSTEEGEKRSRDLGCDLFYEISVREEVDSVKKVIDDLYSRWKYNQHHQHHHSAPQHPLATSTEGQVRVATPPTPNGTSGFHFGRRCLETFTGKCSANKSNSMDVINERDDAALPVSISLGDRIASNEAAFREEGSSTTPPGGKFRSRASTEGSLSYRIRRPFGHHLRHVQPLVIDQPQPAAKSSKPVRRMSISLRGANSAF